MKQKTILIKKTTKYIDKLKEIQKKVDYQENEIKKNKNTLNAKNKIIKNLENQKMKLVKKLKDNFNEIILMIILMK